MNLLEKQQKKKKRTIKDLGQKMEKAVQRNASQSYSKKLLLED